MKSMLIQASRIVTGAITVMLEEVILAAVLLGVVSSHIYHCVVD